MLTFTADTPENPQSSGEVPRFPLVALLLLVPAPTIGVLAAMVIPATRGTTIGQLTYFFSKLWILALPVGWLVLVNRSRFPIPRFTRKGLLAGVLSGLLIAFFITIAYCMLPADAIDVQSMRAAADKNNLLNHANYIALAVYLIFINSLLEEYVWRWFVFRCASAIAPPLLAALASAIFFTLHHFIALHAQTTLLAAAMASAGVFLGGATWSLLYARYRSIWPGYASHVIADIAVFVIGWDILFQAS